MALKVADETGPGIMLMDVVNGVAYAIDHNVDILNLSLGFNGTASQFNDLQDELDRARLQGIIAVAAAGNDGVDMVPTGCDKNISCRF